MIDLRLDLFPLALRFQRGNVDLVVEVTDVADDGLILHLRHVVVGDDVLVAGGGHEDVGLAAGVVHGHDAVAFHRGLKGVDGVNLSHPHLSRQRAQRLRGALAHVAITGDHGHLAGDHHVGGALDAIDQRLAAAVQVVELALGDRVVHVDGAEHQRALGRHFLEAVHAGGGFFGHADDLRALAAVPGGVFGQLGLDGGKQDAFFLAARVGQHGGVGFGLLAQVHQQRGIATIVQDHVGAFALRTLGAKLENAMGVVPVILQRLPLDGEHRCPVGSDGGGGVVLGREDIARGPADLRTQGLQGLDQHGRLDGHVQRTGDARALERLLDREFLADGHQARHLGLGDLDFFAAPVGQTDVSNGRVGQQGSFEWCVHGGSRCDVMQNHDPGGHAHPNSWVSVVAG